MFGPGPISLIGSLLSSLDVSRFFSSSIDLLSGSSGSTVVAISSEFRGKAATSGFFIALKSTVVDSDEDLEVSSSFNSSIALKGSFRSVSLLFFFFLLTSSSSKEGERDSSESYSAAAGIFFFGKSVSDSESDSDSDSEEPKGSDRSFLFCLLWLILSKVRNLL